MRAALQARTQAFHETRALWPTWIGGITAASVAALTVGGGPGQPSPLAFATIHGLSQVAFIAAAIGLGAQSFGYEYTHRTLGLMLMLPVSRRRLLLIKATVVAAMLVPLVTYAWALGVFVEVPALPWLSAGAALGFAPLWTMLCRNPLAGVVFAGSVPAMVLIAVSRVITGGTSDGSVEAERAARDTWSWLMVPILTAGAWRGWTLFMRLELIDGSFKDIHLGWRSRRPRDTRPGRPLWRLVHKELRLQQMTFALTTLFVAATTAAALFHVVPESDSSAIAASGVAAAVYWLGLPVLIGSLATADERQCGTLAWQLQLPTPVWQQWAVKVGTVFGLAILLAIGVPMLLAYLLWTIELPNVGQMVVLAMVTTAASLFVSSLCATGVRAAMASLAGIPLVLWLAVSLVFWLSPAPLDHAFWRGREGPWLALASIVVLLLVAFAFVNHRPDPPVASRIWRQTVSLAALIGVGLFAIATVHF
jgi:hypothetical protein